MIHSVNKRYFLLEMVKTSIYLGKVFMYQITYQPRNNWKKFGVLGLYGFYLRWMVLIPGKLKVIEIIAAVLDLPSICHNQSSPKQMNLG